MTQLDFIDNLRTDERNDKLAAIHGETIVLVESANMRRWYFSDNARALYIASLIPLATMRFSDGSSLVCIPDTQIDMATAAAAQHGVTLTCRAVQDNAIDD